LADPAGDKTYFPLAYAVLLIGIVLWQAASNTGQAALQALVPDLVPRSQRGRASGAKAVAELLPALPLILLGRLVDAGELWLTLGLVAGLLCLTTVITILGVEEEPQREPPPPEVGRPLLRLAAQTLIFLITTQTAVSLVRLGEKLLAGWNATATVQIAALGFLGLLGMAGSALVGVYLGARIAIGKQASQRMPFIWWIINRLLFFAAIGSMQGFTLYFLRDVHHIQDVGTMTSILGAILAAFLFISALGGGYLADRIGPKRLAMLSSLIGAGGTFLLLLAPGLPLIVIAACVLGIGTGMFWTTSWSLGTQLVPAERSGRYLGIANLAGAGAGIVGAGIGGPTADLINALQPGAGYLVTFAAYGMLLLFSAVVLNRVPWTDPM
jgi:MFS family permease